MEAKFRNPQRPKLQWDSDYSKWSKKKLGLFILQVAQRAVDRKHNNAT